jgi:hypothetical protein
MRQEKRKLVLMETAFAMREMVVLDRYTFLILLHEMAAGAPLLARVLVVSISRESCR